MGNSKAKTAISPPLNNINLDMLSRAVVGGGCFWCVEALLQRIKGVQKIESGYAGGPTKNPTYESVCSGKSGHAEVCRVYFDPNVIPYSSTFLPTQLSSTSSCTSTIRPLSTARATTPARNTAPSSCTRRATSRNWRRSRKS